MTLRNASCHVVPRMRVNKVTLSSLSYTTTMSIDPSTLSLASPSPSSSSLHDDMDPSHESGPSRKRPRTTSATTSEERKEARAHRNRIAAQNSRDKRKAHFSYLERRVAELEEENRRLRAGGLVPPPIIPISTFDPVFPLHDDRLRSERENQKERENEELKARIRTLEKGWETVMKALAAQGLSTGASASTPAQSTPLPTSTAPTASNTTISPPTDTSSKSFPSPAPSHDSLPNPPSPSHSSPFTPNELFSSVPIRTGTSEPQINDEPTCHLARVATIEPSQAPMSLQRVVSPSLPSPMPYIQALQLKQQRQQQQQWTTTRRWKTSSVRSSRRRNQRIRHCCLLRILPQRK